MRKRWYVVTRLERDAEPKESVEYAHGPLEAALAASTCSMGEETAPYSVEVDRQRRGSTLISIRILCGGSDQRLRFEVTPLDRAGFEGA
jgi:hypothetical protein